MLWGYNLWRHKRPSFTSGFLNQLSADEDVYGGLPVRVGDNGLEVCDINAGMILSQSLLKNFKSNLVKL